MSNEKQGLQPLIDALRNGTETQRREALGALRLLSGEDHGIDPSAWQAWWDRSRAQFMGEVPPTKASDAPPAAPVFDPSGIPDPDLIPRPSGRVKSAGSTRTRAPGSSGISITMVGAVILITVFGYIYYQLHSLGVIERLQGLTK